MSEEIAHKMMCAEKKPEWPAKKPRVGKPMEEAEKDVRRYPAIEPPGPWPGPRPPEPGKIGSKIRIERQA